MPTYMSNTQDPLIIPGLEVCRVHLGDLKLGCSLSEGCFALILPRICIPYQYFHSTQTLDSNFSPLCSEMLSEVLLTSSG